MLVEQVRAVREGQLQLHVDALWLLASIALVLLSYVVLIEAWVYILAALSGRRLSFVTAARIWFISNLSVYIPAGPGWQIVQMGVMSAEQGIGGVSASAASIINAAINIACGLAVAAIGGASFSAQILGEYAWLAWSAAVVAALAVAALPLVLRLVFRVARDTFGLPVPGETPPARVIVMAAALNIVAWILYGFALQALSMGILGAAPGTIAQYTAAFAAAYVFGYILFVVPGGIGAREGMLARILVAGGLSAGPPAALLAIASRIVLIVVQVVPALLFLAYRRRPFHETNTADG